MAKLTTEEFIAAIKELTNSMTLSRLAKKNSAFLQQQA